MFEKLTVTTMAEALAAHAGARQGVIAANIAQADTPGYRARALPSFAETYRQDAAMRATRTGHLPPAGPGEPVPQAVPGAAAPNGNTVSLEAELVQAAGVRQEHDMALAVFRSVSDILRASLGRR